MTAFFIGKDKLMIIVSRYINHINSSGLEMNVMIEYCDKCKKKMLRQRLLALGKTFNVCVEDVGVDAQILTCANCGEELDAAALVKAYNKYLRRHKLLLPEEIKEIREQYGLSQRNFAKLLNWGDKTIYRYENGSFQDKIHNSLLLLLKNPECMRMYLMENELFISEKQKAKLLKRVDELQNYSII